jgi:thiamine biosynthesis lipoprotein
MEELEFRAMNTDIVLVGEGEPAAVAEGFWKARAFIEASEARFTRFSDDSELAQLNRAAGVWFHASAELFDVVQQARAYVDQTDGLFDPSILDALENAGYDKSMDEIRVRGPGQPRPAPKHPAVEFRAVQLDATRRAILLPRGMRLDLGGIAKGWIAERAALDLAAVCNACAVNAGGDVFAVGLPAEEGAWRVALEDPRDTSRTLAVLRVEQGAIATSSITRRYWRQGERFQHHLIDPRRGLPAETDWLSVTVIAPHATVAEVFAKALLIAGSRDAGHVAARRDDITFIAVNRAGQLWGSMNAKEFLDVGIEPTRT